MSKRQRESFLTTLLSDLLSLYPQWHINDHSKIEWIGQPKNMWPEADLLINVSGRQFIVEYDEDSDPGRSLTKYWPLIHENRERPLTIIEVWKRGLTVGRSYAELARWMGMRLMGMYPRFAYEFVERKDESAGIIAKKVAEIIENSRI